MAKNSVPPPPPPPGALTLKLLGESLPREFWTAVESWNRQDAPYFAAVGRFISEYAQAEAAVHLAVRKLSGLSDEKARVIFGGHRLVDLSDRIHALIKIDKISEENKAEIELCLSQLSIISKIRHNLVHRPLAYKDAAIQASNIMTAKSISAAVTDKFTILDLHHMTIDCVRIFSRLFYATNPSARITASPDVQAWLHEPWQYTPPKQDDPTRPRQPTPRGRRRPPPPSRE